jgi:hypothetical protein
MNEMTQEQAMQIVANVFAAHMGNRKDHEVLAQAFNTLTALLPKPPEPAK